MNEALDTIQQNITWLVIYIKLSDSSDFRQRMRNFLKAYDAMDRKLQNLESRYWFFNCSTCRFYTGSGTGGVVTGGVVTGSD